MKKICILGLGYIGLPTAIMFALSGYSVVGVDVDKDIVNNLRIGRIHIRERGLKECFEKVKEQNNFQVKTQPEESDVFIISVPTPLDKKRKRADLRYVIQAAKSIVPILRKNNLVILESTVPPRTTTDVVVPILEKSGLKAGKDFFVAHCPERVLPGNILKEIVENDRIIGGIDKKSAVRAKKLYQSFVKGKIYVTDSTTAEFVKLLENTYRDVNIALANEIAKIAERLGINVWDAINLANKHPRVNLHLPGPGVGGHCIPIDPWFVYEKAPDLANLIKLSRTINDSMPKYVIQLIKKLLPEKGRITLLGASYKKNVDDARESPTLKIAKLAEEEGFMVKIHDPLVKKFELPLYSLEDAVKNSDCIVLVTDHDIFKRINPATISKLVRKRNLIDTRNALNHAKWKQAGFTVKVLGA